MNVQAKIIIVCTYFVHIICTYKSCHQSILIMRTNYFLCINIVGNFVTATKVTKIDDSHQRPKEKESNRGASAF